MGSGKIQVDGEDKNLGVELSCVDPVIIRIIIYNQIAVYA